MKTIYLLAASVLSLVCHSAHAKVGEENWSPQRDVAQEQKTLVQMKPKSGAKDIKGSVEFEQIKEGVLITTTLEGLKPGSTHGFHIHEKGDCSADDAKSAGDHFNPTDNPHGKPGKAHHVGDLGNITADRDGKVSVEKIYPHLTMDQKSKSSILGRAVIVHAKADNLKSQPAGDAGDRIACGVIAR